MATETKKTKDSKKKINESFNYGRVPLSSKSVERNIVKRESGLDNRINRKYR